MGNIFKSSRMIITFALIAILVLTFGIRLYNIQIVNNDFYIAESKKGDSYKVQIPAARGEIRDRNGNPLVINRQGNSIYLDAAYFPSAKNNAKRNEVIINLINLFERQGQEWVNELPLILDESGNLAFAEDMEKEIAKMKSREMLSLNTYADESNCYDALVEKYEIKGYSVADTLKIAAIRYELSLKSFSVSNPVTIAEDVSSQTVQIIKENNSAYLGADVQIVPYREYVDGTVAPHILGITGKITAEDYDNLKQKGYGMNDIIGQSGIEKSMEPYLKGTAGEMTVTIDDEGSVTKKVTKEPIQGDTIVLSIDRDLQIVAQNALAEVVNSIAPDSAGAVVVQNVNTGEILAAASYPTYNIAEYRENYEALAKSSMKPLFNRFAQGAYAPGSTFKPAMTIAALEEGAIDASTTFKCSSAFTYAGHTFGCLDAHGTINAETALEKSCNIFFYNCALGLGIEKMNQYCTDLGLGQKTGVEIPETKGILAGRAYSDSVGSIWRPGDTVQAGIGQSDNLFTPLQLASYCSVIANGGTRYQSRLVKQIMTYDCSEIINQNEPIILEKMTIKDSTLQTVKSGMRRVATNGAPASVFKNMSIPVSAKTGTSQVKNPDGTNRNNGFLITFAPSDKPELAIASAVELAGSGTSTAMLTKEILNFYYSDNDYVSVPQGYLTLLQ